MFLAAAATKPAALLDKESQVSLPTLAKTVQVDLVCPIDQTAPVVEVQAPYSATTIKAALPEPARTPNLKTIR